LRPTLEKQLLFIKSDLVLIWRSQVKRNFRPTLEKQLFFIKSNLVFKSSEMAKTNLYSYENFIRIFEKIVKW